MAYVLVVSCSRYGCMVGEKCYLHAMPEQFALENISLHLKLLLF